MLRTLLSADDSLEVDAIDDGRAALEALSRHSYSLVLTDLQMPHLDGMKLIEYVQQQRLPITIIVMTGFGSIDTAVQAMRVGAYDFLTKPVDADHLRLVIQRAFRERSMQDELARLREQLQHQYSFQNVLSKSPRMHAVFELINHVAPTNATVLIEGETGTGKEQVARAIHGASAAYRQGPMVPIHCAALPESLLESELFGHEKGSFTGAALQRTGRFEQAEGGTVFLDEVGDIPPSMQVKLLRVLQERQIERVGGAGPIEVDVRIIAATNRSLPKLVKEGKFREDLYYRLNVVKIELPPLRERLEDVPLLATHFAAKYARPGEAAKKISAAAMEHLLGLAWPGNVRQLENAVERACVVARGPEIQVPDLPLELTSVRAAPATPTIDLDRRLPEIVREAVVNIESAYLRRAMKKSHGSIERCARISGLSRRSIFAKLREYQIDKKKFKLD
jgi:DNA-binding NtrC family response regulator